jgi:hypothetical protein
MRDNHQAFTPYIIAGKPADTTWKTKKISVPNEASGIEKQKKVFRADVESCQKLYNIGNRGFVLSHSAGQVREAVPDMRFGWPEPSEVCRKSTH